MKQDIIPFSRLYLDALRLHLAGTSRLNSKLALELGGRAVNLGIETLELAKIHVQALKSLKTSPRNMDGTRRAGIFFTKVNDFVQESHRAKGRSKVHLSKIMASLRQRTEELATSNHKLKQGVARRKTMEVAFEKRGHYHNKRLEESIELQSRLRLLTHQVLAAQEDERNKISHELQDEIAQTLLGINVRLLSLNKQNKNDGSGLKSNIANTRKLVAKSVKSVQVVARRLGRS
jgi:signal transduction histidine kinase